jgi:HTH-type transcriptional regulator / antitoxin HipB
VNYPILTPQQLSAHLRSLRKARGLTQAQLGEKLGLNQARIGKIESHPESVSVGQLLTILALLGARLVLATGETPGTRLPADTSPDW